MSLDREIQSSLRYSVRRMDIKISDVDIDEFLELEKKRKSISVLNDECVSHVETFLEPADMMSYVIVCKDDYSRVNQTRGRIVLYYFPNHILPANSTYQWTQLCMDWFTFKLRDNTTTAALVSEIRGVETDIKYCADALEQIKAYKNPTYQARIAKIVNRRQIESEKKRIGEIWESASTEFQEVIGIVRWLIPSGLITDLPTLTNELYGGMSREEFYPPKEVYSEPSDDEWDEGEWMDRYEADAAAYLNALANL